MSNFLKSKTRFPLIPLNWELFRESSCFPEMEPGVIDIPESPEEVIFENWKSCVEDHALYEVKEKYNLWCPDKVTWYTFGNSMNLGCHWYFS